MGVERETMTRLPMTCTCCGVALRGELDTFGDIGNELCEGCWYKLYDETNGVQYYGLAPHHHDLSITGSFIGSTIFDDYKATSKQDDTGRYWIEDRKMWFRPDEEVGGDSGMWEER